MDCKLFIKYLKNLIGIGSDGQGNQQDSEKVKNGVEIIGCSVKKRQKKGQKAKTVPKKGKKLKIKKIPTAKTSP